MSDEDYTCNYRLVSLESNLNALRADLLGWQLDHLRYHESNEHRWGLVALMIRHPIRTMIAGIFIGAVLVVSPASALLIKMIIYWLK